MPTAAAPVLPALVPLADTSARPSEQNTVQPRFPPQQTNSGTCPCSLCFSASPHVQPVQRLLPPPQRELQLFPALLFHLLLHRAMSSTLLLLLEPPAFPPPPVLHLHSHNLRHVLQEAAILAPAAAPTSRLRLPPQESTRSPLHPTQEGQLWPRTSARGSHLPLGPRAPKQQPPLLPAAHLAATAAV